MLIERYNEVKKHVEEACKRVGRCLLYTSDAADEEDSGGLGGRRITKKKKRNRGRTLRKIKLTLRTPME